MKTETIVRKIQGQAEEYGCIPETTEQAPSKRKSKNSGNTQMIGGSWANFVAEPLPQAGMVGVRADYGFTPSYDTALKGKVSQQQAKEYIKGRYGWQEQGNFLDSYMTQTQGIERNCKAQRRMLSLFRVITGKTTITHQRIEKAPTMDDKICRITGYQPARIIKYRE